MIKYRIAQTHDAENLLTTRYDAVINNGTAKYATEILLAWAPKINSETILGEMEMIKDPNRITIVAEDVSDVANPKMAGFGTLDTFKKTVTQCYVSPDYSKRGIGNQLMDRIEAVAKQHGIKVLGISSSLIACEFQKARGFKALELYEYDLGDGLSITCYMMEKVLE